MDPTLSSPFAPAGAAELADDLDDDDAVGSGSLVDRVVVLGLAGDRSDELTTHSRLLILHVVRIGMRLVGGGAGLAVLE